MVPRDHKASLSVWLITLGVGESVTKDDFETCSKAVDKSCVPKHTYLKGETAWRYIVGCLLPQMVMRQKHYPRNKWSFFKSKQMEGTGKPYIAMTGDTADEPLAMGFSVAETGAAMAFAHSFGAKHQVTNIGAGIRAATPGVSTNAYVSSHLHEITSKEERSLSLEVTGSEEVTVRRLNIILAVKDAYIKAIGQPVGFDYSRIDCDVQNKQMSVDGESLAGWHIRLFAANLGATEELKKHNAPLRYQVAVAVFRGGHGMKFSFAQSAEELNSFVTFFDVKEVVNAVPRLGEYDNAAMPPLDKIPLSTKNSMASIKMSEKEKERLREKERNERPVVPSIPPQYQKESKSSYSHTQPTSIPPQPSKLSKSHTVSQYPADVNVKSSNPLPLPPQISASYPTSQAYVSSHSKAGLPPAPVPSGPVPPYTTSSRHQHSSSSYSYSNSQQQPYSQPIHTARR